MYMNCKTPTDKEACECVPASEVSVRASLHGLVCPRVFCVDVGGKVVLRV